jgi:glutamate synthase (NADPH) large chain
MALLIGYGAGAINPYLAFESIEDLIAEGMHGLGRHGPAQGGQELHQGLRQGRAQGDVEDGHLDGGVVHRRPDLRGDRSRRELVDVLHRHRQPLGGIGLDVIAAEVRRHATPWPTRSRPEERAHRKLELGGEYQWRREGEYHLFNPETVFKLQHATRAKRYDIFKEYTRQGRRPVERPDDAARAVRVRRRTGSRSRSTRSSRSARS